MFSENCFEGSQSAVLLEGMYSNVVLLLSELHATLSSKLLTGKVLTGMSWQKAEGILKFRII